MSPSRLWLSSTQSSGGPFQMPSASHRTRKIGALMFSVGQNTTVKLLSGMRISFRWTTELITSMTVRRRSLFSRGRRARREANVSSKVCDGGLMPEKLGNARVLSEGAFRKGPSRGPVGSEGPFPPSFRTGASCSSMDFLTFVSVSIAASKYGLRARVRMGSGTVHNEDEVRDHILRNRNVRTFSKVRFEDGCHCVRVQIARCTLQHVEIRASIELRSQSSDVCCTSADTV